MKKRFNSYSQYFNRIKCELASQDICKCLIFLGGCFYLGSSCCVQLETSFPAWPKKGQWWSPGCAQLTPWPLFFPRRHLCAKSSHYRGAPGELRATRRCPGDERALSGWSLRLRGYRKRLTSPEISARDNISHVNDLKLL